VNVKKSILQKWSMKIKIDKCSECKGIWLDAGELETASKIEKSGIDKLFSVFK
jgi:Zn-finger nucleic acid-binding protein